MVICPIDKRCADQISALLQPPSALQLQAHTLSLTLEYFDQLLSKRQCLNIEVLQNLDTGKGVYARCGIGEGQVILQDEMLVGAQHTSNKIDCLVCSFCFRFIGSIELQIGRRLFLNSLGASAISNSSDEEDDLSCPHFKSETNGASCTSENIPLGDGTLKSLMTGQLQLPYSSIFSLPPVVACLGECEETYYCSKSCAQADWEHSHSLLCTGDKSLSISRKALLKFIQNANDTNDIFLLAAKHILQLIHNIQLSHGLEAISFIISRYRKLKTIHCVKKLEKAAPDVMQDHCLSLLLDAWKPFSVGYKQRWWDSVALPEDVDASEETTFRMQIKELAFTSLQLLKEAIFDKECEPLFSLEIYGQIIGMFELNNLDLIVASPVEDYFLYIDDLPYLEKIEAEKVTQPYLDSLDDYSISCQGTAFYPLQSCMNHSCRPNAKAFKREEDRDGRATIIALKQICSGEEVTISYIDEDLPVKERQALLSDYGFKCGCKRCKDENPS